MTESFDVMPKRTELNCSHW